MRIPGGPDIPVNKEIAEEGKPRTSSKTNASRADASSQAKSADAEATARPSSSEAVVVSGNVSAQSARATQSETARQNRIEQLRKDIAEGRYTVDRDALAEKILDEELARVEKAKK